MTTEEALEKLQFVRLKIARLIPRSLIEAVKGRTFTPEQFYEYQDAQVDNPSNYLYAIVDEKKVIHGYLWAETNALDHSLFVNTFSIDKEYWGKGKAIPMAIAFVDELRRKLESPRVFWVTSNAKFFTKHGFRQSKQVLMEYQESKLKEDS